MLYIRIIWEYTPHGNIRCMTFNSWLHGKVVSGSIQAMSDTFKNQTNLISQMISNLLQFL